MSQTSTNNLHVSFVIPSYNYGNYLEFCVDSILAQSYENLSVWILDDASKDNTKKIAEKLCKKDWRIKFYQHPQNVGPVANWNACLETAYDDRADLIWLISADDALCDSRILEKFVQQFNNNPQLGIAFCRAQLIDENNNPLGKFIPKKGSKFPPESEKTYTPKQFFPWIVQANFMPVLGTIARKECYTKIGGFDKELIHTGDWFNWLRMTSEWETFYTPNASVLYRQHQTNLSQNYENKAYPIENTLLCYKKLKRFITQRPELLPFTLDLNQAEHRFKKKHGLSLNLGDKLKLKLAKWQGKLLN